MPVAFLVFWLKFDECMQHFFKFEIYEYPCHFFVFFMERSECNFCVFLLKSVWTNKKHRNHQIDVISSTHVLGRNRVYLMISLRSLLNWLLSLRSPMEKLTGNSPGKFVFNLNRIPRGFQWKLTRICPVKFVLSMRENSSRCSLEIDQKLSWPIVYTICIGILKDFDGKLI